jgi:hypothetical protein
VTLLVSDEKVFRAAPGLVASYQFNLGLGSPKPMGLDFASHCKLAGKIPWAVARKGNKMNSVRQCISDKADSLVNWDFHLCVTHDRRGFFIILCQKVNCGDG